jgi:hypothetical protein
MRGAVLCVLLLCSCAERAFAQTADVSGPWAVQAEAASGVTPSGGTWSRSATSGTLEIVQDGSALKGTWTGPKGEPWSFTGRIEKDRFEVTTVTRDVPATIDGQQTTVPYRWVFRGTAANNRLTGTMAFGRAEKGDDAAQPFTAERR